MEPLLVTAPAGKATLKLLSLNEAELSVVANTLWVTGLDKLTALPPLDKLSKLESGVVAVVGAGVVVTPPAAPPPPGEAGALGVVPPEPADVSDVQTVSVGVIVKVVVLPVKLLI